MKLFLPASLLLACISSFAQTVVSVSTQHNDLHRTGWNNKETILDHSNVIPGKFGCIGTLSVDDQVYAQPLLISNISIGNYTGPVLYTATVNNSVYAFNSNDVSQGAPLWQVNLSPAGQRSPSVADLKDDVQGTPCEANYQDFTGRFGLVGTPVIDTLTNTLYVATKTVDSAGNFYAYINALDIKTGLHKPGSPHLMTAQVNGTGAGAINGKLSYLAKFQNQRPALLLYNNTVYVASAAYCDWGPYHGWILGFDASTLALKYSYTTTPDGAQGGIWMAGEGMSVGDDGNLYVTTGNGTTNPNNTFVGGRSESLLKLTPQLTPLDWFTPSNYDYLDQQDLDYGSDGALIIPHSSTTVSGSKEGISYIVDYNNMGRYNPLNSQVKDTLEFNPARTGYVHVHGSPVYSSLSTGEFVYAWAESFKIRQFTFNRATGTFLKTFQQGGRQLAPGMPGAMLSISSNGADTSSAIVWASFPTYGNANHETRPGTLAAYRANDVSLAELWNSGESINDDPGNFAKFNSSTVANGQVYLPTFSKAIKVYGLSCSTASVSYSNGNGLKGEYFTNTSPASDFPSEATITEADANVNFNWGRLGPLPGISGQNFKVRWTGRLRPLTDENYTIYLTASDGVRLWINNVLLIDSWTDKPVVVHSGTISLLKSTDYDIKLEYYAGSNPATCILQWSSPGICKQNIPTSQLFPETADCSSNGAGLVAEYFTNSDPSVPFPAIATLKKTEPDIDFDWGYGSPPGISTDHFKARFSGYVQSLDSGRYTFYVTADDGVRLWVNDKLLIDNWIDQPTTDDSASIVLPQCTKTALRLEYFENGGNAVCRLQWSGPTVGKQVIPSTQLFIEPDSTILSKSFVIYPNPNSIHSLTISTTANFQQGGHVAIYNLLGQMVTSSDITPGNTQIKIITIPLQLARGLYIVRLSAKSKTYSAKLMVL
jgi:PA14 domain/Secretion system C-terminal sorting domain